ncbi:MAG: putative nad-dependent epimerase/dehydratase,dtdp-4-dehydrorhamnose reductase, oxidoreductase protein [Candidatus Gottesmanbacteria bacterium GW2011_GWA1_44_24b]|uniref:dTDP-4-dehydrorhamnose reductase n=1 Tax=Candidatus Gottesmanbacteria bacterium GW2011_GWA1_44_24b TaxID=1618437 RepID=A0A0G1KRP7_9BACT|nr:MAG: putative nad-dependent epimerase/dehydratase,dtdp-4-dehydrorhamnose reductase, oxidoreductase protein [Candidatus Gottesmanbacteria bacterium GW2011_GWA1_44_24b]
MVEYKGNFKITINELRINIPILLRFAPRRGGGKSGLDGYSFIIRGVAQLASAFAWGAKGCSFKSSHPDKIMDDKTKISIIGASSYVGARLYFDLKSKFIVVGTYSSNQLSKNFIYLDITNKKEVEKVINDIRPNVIIHVANNASAKWCDTYPEKAVLLNQTATQYIADSANKVNAKLIYISTMGAVKPSNLYGKTKSKSEKIIKTSKYGYLILRPSLILGYSPNTTNDRPFNRLLKNLDEGVSAVYDTSWKFQPTYIRHMSEVITACINNKIFNRSIVIAVTEMKSRYDTARDILTPFGIKVTPVDAKDSTFEVFKDDLSELNYPRL